MFYEVFLSFVYLRDMYMKNMVFMMLRYFLKSI